jgi:signal transduction histidine kinase
VANRAFNDPSERILILAPTGRDGPLTHTLLAQAGLAGHVSHSMGELCDELAAGAALLILAEEVLVPSAITLLGNVLARQEPWSDLPIILFTGEGATVQARAPTLELLAPLGNVTLLDRPVRPTTMLSAVQSALRARRRQYATRDTLAEEQRAVHERDQFLAMLGHELRNPLGPILLALEMMDRMGAGADSS